MEGEWSVRTLCTHGHAAPGPAPGRAGRAGAAARAGPGRAGPGGGGPRARSRFVCPVCPVPSRPPNPPGLPVAAGPAGGGWCPSRSPAGPPRCFPAAARGRPRASLPAPGPAGLLLPGGAGRGRGRGEAVVPRHAARPRARPPSPPGLGCGSPGPAPSSLRASPAGGDPVPPQRGGDTHRQEPPVRGPARDPVPSDAPGPVFSSVTQNFQDFLTFQQDRSQNHLGAGGGTPGRRYRSRSPPPSPVAPGSGSSPSPGHRLGPRVPISPGEKMPPALTGASPRVLPRSSCLPCPFCLPCPLPARVPFAAQPCCHVPVKTGTWFSPARPSLQPCSAVGLCLPGHGDPPDAPHGPTEPGLGGGKPLRVRCRRGREEPGCAEGGGFPTPRQ
ncbi:basic proline-rich protein-like [Grus americana]|uniref:basic proline-rich protein-like n=1 Tax=Grus americana TaxID=9117 RepID=UPI002407C9FF|nr:basic proline-rich protein-like [Grus americana]